MGNPELTIPVRVTGSHCVGVHGSPQPLQVNNEDGLTPQTAGLGSTQVATLGVTCPSSQSPWAVKESGLRPGPGLSI